MRRSPAIAVAIGAAVAAVVVVIALALADSAPLIVLLLVVPLVALALAAMAARRDLTPHQREVLVALAVDGVPIDVLAERLGTTRGALYKTLHDARRKLRRRLTADGLLPPPDHRASDA